MKYLILTSLIALFSSSSTSVFADDFNLEIKSTDFYQFEVKVNGNVAANGGSQNSELSSSVGELLVAGPNQVEVCFTPNEKGRLPRAKDIAKVTLQTPQQRQLASNRRLSAEQKYYFYAVAPFGENYVANSPSCKTFPITIAPEQVAEYGNAVPAKAELPPPAAGNAMTAESVYQEPPAREVSSMSDSAPAEAPAPMVEGAPLQPPPPPSGPPPSQQ